MNGRNRLRIALASTFPTLLIVPACCLLAAFGMAPRSLLLAPPIALAVHAAITFVRLRPRPPAADCAAGAPDPSAGTR